MLVAIYTGVSENTGLPYFGVLIIRILLCRVLYEGPLFSETPIRVNVGACIRNPGSSIGFFVMEA